jgi:hypothetical protein
MAKARKDKLQILYKPPVDAATQRRRMLHASDCPFAFRPKGRDRDYRDATPEEIRTHDRCSKC